MTVTFLRRPQQKDTTVQKKPPAGRDYRKNPVVIDKPEKVVYTDSYFENYYRKDICTVCRGTKRVLVYDECPTCYGESKSCTTCNGTGLVRNHIICPECRRK